MEKSIHSRKYALFVQHLRAARQSAGLTQVEIAVNLRTTQSFVSKCERGERRLDIVEVSEFCEAIGISLTSFVAELDEALAGS